MNKGIPTTFENTRFRSRLEARWAAFFDLIEWPWVYEPMDLPGWIPDFLIKGPAPFLVEVKPSVTVERLIKQCGPKAMTANPEMDVLLCGVDPTVMSMGQYIPTYEHITANGETVIDDSYLTWYEGDESNPNLMHFCPRSGRMVVAHYLLGWKRSPCGHTGKDYCYLNTADQDHIQRLWREAGNEVQWKKS